MLTKENTIFVLIDVQGKHAETMSDKAELFKNLQKLVQGVKVLDVPIVWMEQIPDKMGKTIPQLQELLSGETPIGKASFSCCGEPAFVARLESSGRKQVLLAGVEAHVCVSQTAADLIRRGFHVEVVADAVSSRTPSDKQIGLEKAKEAGASITSVETALFEMLVTAGSPEFKEILKIVK